MAIQIARDSNRMSSWRFKPPAIQIAFRCGDTNRPRVKSRFKLAIQIARDSNRVSLWRYKSLAIQIAIPTSRDPNRVSLWRYKSPAIKLAFQVARGVSHCSHQSRSVQKLFPCTFLCRCLYPTAAAHGPRNAIRIATDLAQHRD